MSCSPNRFGGYDPTGFHRLLVFALAETHPDLAKRVIGFRPAEAIVLYDHFRPRPEASDLTEKESRTLAEACVSAAFPVRFVRAFQGTLARLLSGKAPRLARKVALMDGHDFERLYHEALGRQRRGA